MQPLKNLFPLLMLACVLVLLSGCAVQARMPWGNLDLKGGSGSECKPYVAPDSGAGHTLRAPVRVVRPVAPLAPVAPITPIAEPEPVEVSGTPWPQPCEPVLVYRPPPCSSLLG